MGRPGHGDHDRDSDEQSDDCRSEDLDMDGGRSVCAGCYATYRIVVALLVRLILLIHASMAVWLVVSLTSTTLLWCLLAANVLLVLETLYTIFKRGGKENKWISPCFLAYLAAVLPPIWLVELDRLQRFNDALDQNSNFTSLTEVNGLTIPIKLEPEVWVSVMEQALLFLLVLCRWLLPRGDITRQELSQLLFVFMGIASDNMELFELFDEPEVRKDRILTYVVLGVWSLSLLQFVFVLTATRSPRKIKVAHHFDTAESRQAEERAKGKKRRKKSTLEVIFATEIWSLLFSVLVQDGPYAGTRIYTLIRYDLLTYSIIFFICKNLLVICLVFYRLVIICIHKCTDSDDDDDKNGDDDEKSSENSWNGAKVDRNKRLINASRHRKVEPVQLVSLEGNGDISNV